MSLLHEYAAHSSSLPPREESQSLAADSSCRDSLWLKPGLGPWTRYGWQAARRTSRRVSAPCTLRAQHPARTQPASPRGPLPRVPALRLRRRPVIAQLHPSCGHARAASASPPETPLGFQGLIYAQNTLKDGEQRGDKCADLLFQRLLKSCTQLHSI